MKQLFLAIAAGTLLVTSTIGSAAGAEHAGKSAEHAGKSAEHAGKSAEHAGKSAEHPARAAADKAMSRNHVQLSLLHSSIDLDLSGSQTPGTNRDSSEVGLRLGFSLQIEQHAFLFGRVATVDYGNDVDAAMTRVGLGMGYFNQLGSNPDAEYLFGVSVDIYDFDRVKDEGLTLLGGLRGRVAGCLELQLTAGLVFLDEFDGLEFRTGLTWPLRDRIDVYGGLGITNLQDDSSDRVEWAEVEAGIRYRF